MYYLQSISHIRKKAGASTLLVCSDPVLRHKINDINDISYWAGFMNAAYKIHVSHFELSYYQMYLLLCSATVQKLLSCKYILSKIPDKKALKII